MTTNSKAYEDIINFIAAGISPMQIIKFKPSKESNTRVTELLDRERNQSLTTTEKSELDHYLLLEHIMRLAKAKARINLSKKG